MDSRSSSRISSAVAAASLAGDSAIGLGIIIAEGGEIGGIVGAVVSTLGRLAELMSESEVTTEEERALPVVPWDGFGEEETPGVLGRLSVSIEDVLRIAVPIRERSDFGGVVLDISKDKKASEYEVYVNECRETCLLIHYPQ